MCFLAWCLEKLMPEFFFFFFGKGVVHFAIFNSLKQVNYVIRECAFFVDGELHLAPDNPNWTRQLCELFMCSVKNERKCF